MEFMRRAKGSISIFLCIILMPMVTYSTMIIDASRMQVARTNIATAGDLAMNAALSEYDKVLQDMYGLFAMVQTEEDKDDFEQQLKSYFNESLEGRFQAVELDANDYVGTGATYIGDAIIGKSPAEKIDNLTNLLLMSAEELDYQPITGSTLANQAVMKRQIIEYMKYKGPVSIATTLLPKLEFLKDSSKQTDVVNQKVKYTKTLDAIKDPCKKAWELIEGANGYQQCKADYDAKDLDGAIKSARENYQKMSRAILMSKHPEIKIDESQMEYWGWDGLLSEEFENEFIIYAEYPGKDNHKEYKEYLDGMIDIFSGFYNLKNDEYSYLQNCFYIYNKPQYESWKSTLDDAYTFTEDSSYDAWLTAAPGFSIEMFNKGELDELQAIKDKNQYFANSKPDVGDIDGLSKYYQDQVDTYNIIIERDYITLYRIIRACNNNDNMSSFVDVYKHWLRCAFNDVVQLKKDKNGEEDAAADMDDDPDQLYNEYSVYLYYYKMMESIVNDVPFGEYANEIQDLLIHVGDKNIYIEHANYYAQEAPKELRSYYEAVNKVKTISDEVVSALDDVIKKIEAADKQKNKWQESVGKLSDGTTKSQMQSDLDSTTNGMKIEDVKDFKAVFEDISKKFDKHLKGLETIKFFDVVIVSDKGGNLDSFKNKDAYKSLNEKSENDRATDITKDKSEKGYFDPGKPDKQTATKIDGIPKEQKFYNTLKSIYEAKKPEMDSEQQNQLSTINQSSNGDTTGTEGEKPSENPVDKEDPTEPTIDASKDNGASEIKIGDIYEQIRIESVKKGLPEEETVESDVIEGNSSIKTVNVDKDDEDFKDDAGKAEDSLAASTGILEKIANLGENLVEYAYMEEYFTEMFTCRTDATATDPPILLNGYSIPAPGTDATTMAKTVNRNTEWFGKEIEYIIWGDSDMHKNWVKTDALIYTIRFALNAIYAFTAQDIQIFATQVATAIAGWTVIGVPIVAACITVAIALAETAYDLVLLHMGEDVAIYKNASTFVCSPTGIVKGAKDLVKIAADKSIDAIENKVDSIAEKAKADSAGAIADANNYIDNYVTEQANQINASITDIFITPIMNTLLPVATDFDGSTDKAKEKFLESIDAALENAFTIIKNNIDNNLDKDTIIYDISIKAYDSIKSEVTAEVKAFFQEQVDKADFSAVKKLNELKSKLVDDEITSGEEPSGVISKILYKYRSKITDTVNDKADKLKNKVEKAINDSSGNVKSIIRDGINDISGSLSDSIGTKLEGMTDTINLENKKTKDASISNGFTLNYKEYCKIFVLIKLVAKQEPKMLNRAAAIIEANVRTANGTKSDAYRTIDAYTLIGIESKVKMGTLFPWGVSVDDASGSTGEVDLNLDFQNLGENFVTINYQAVNGY